jgi:hypothetical protein
MAKRETPHSPSYDRDYSLRHLLLTGSLTHRQREGEEAQGTPPHGSPY